MIIHRKRRHRWIKSGGGENVGPDLRWGGAVGAVVNAGFLN